MGKTLDSNTAFYIVMVSFAVMPAVAWVFGFFTKTRAGEAFPVRPSMKWLIAAYPLILLAEYLGQMVHPVPADPMMTQFLTDWSWWQLTLAIIIAAPLAEEYVFRGVLLVWLHKKIGEVGAVVLTAIGWAALHTQYDWVWMAVIAVAGLVLGLIRTRGGSLWLVIAIHAANNAVALVAM